MPKNCFNSPVQQNGDARNASPTRLQRVIMQNHSQMIWLRCRFLPTWLCQLDMLMLLAPKIVLTRHRNLHHVARRLLKPTKQVHHLLRRRILGFAKKYKSSKVGYKAQHTDFCSPTSKRKQTKGSFLSDFLTDFLHASRFISSISFKISWWMESRYAWLSRTAVVNAGETSSESDKLHLATEF